MSDGSASPWAAMRAEYSSEGLHEHELEPDPMSMFRRWLDDTVTARLPEPNAMVLSTVSEEGQPSSRMVLLKDIDEWGFVFYSNLLSRKGVELAGNPACTLLFPWHPIERQVRIDGVASQLLREDVSVYFSGRPRGAQLGAWASHQSSQVAGRTELEDAYAAAETRYPESIEVPVPPEWGGYVVRPSLVEFWQGRRDRLHDRLVYRRSDDADLWTVERLAP
ncbi:MAG: pyridoxamine 5'-phosphate oxidase [Nocardioides sp.]